MKFSFVISVVVIACIASFAEERREHIPDAIEVAAPGYPRLPSGVHEDGEVCVEVTVDSNGVVTETRAFSGPESLRKAAKDAAYRWRFNNKINGAEYKLFFVFMQLPGLGDPPKISSVYKPPDRMEIYGEFRELVIIADPEMELNGKKAPEPNRKKRGK